MSVQCCSWILSDFCQLAIYFKEMFNTACSPPIFLALILISVHYNANVLSLGRLSLDLSDLIRDQAQSRPISLYSLLAGQIQTDLTVEGSEKCVITNHHLHCKMTCFAKVIGKVTFGKS